MIRVFIAMVMWKFGSWPFGLHWCSGVSEFVFVDYVNIPAPRSPLDFTGAVEFVFVDYVNLPAP